MSTIQLEVTDEQLVDLVKRLPPAAKNAVLQSLIPDLDRFETLVDYGIQQARRIAHERGLNWDILTEAERDQLVDTWLHEN